MTTLSILIPSYNHSKYIIDTLNSHVENNPFDYEIIIIDDGSTDQSPKLIQEWVTNHPEVKTKFFSRENRGVTATLNQLVDLAEGEFIRFFGSDDLSAPHANEVMIDFLTKNKADAVFGFCEVIDQNGKIIADNSIIQLGKTIDLYQENLSKAIIANWAVVGPSLILRKSAFLKVGKFNEKSLIEDWYLYLNLLAKTDLRFVNKVVAQYRHHDTNASRTKDPVRRIKNYQSQIMSGKDCLTLYVGKRKRYLLEAVSLLELKLSFVEKSPVEMIIKGIKFLYYKSLNLF